MNGTYPQFKTSYIHEELVEHFLLTPADLHLVLSCRGDANRCGMALFLKTLTYLGYVPDSLDCVPPEVPPSCLSRWHHRLRARLRCSHAGHV